VQAHANAVQTEARAEADRVLIAAEARAKAAALEAEAAIAMAEATRKRGEAEADARRRHVEAENALSTKFLLRDVVVKALEVMPDVTRELMQPAKAISEIKVLQLQGTAMNGSHDNGHGNGGGGNGHAMFGTTSPILKTILEAGAAYPLLREMLAFSQVDTGKVGDKIRAVIGALPAEIKSAIDSDPDLASKLEALGQGAVIAIPDPVDSHPAATSQQAA